MSDEIVAIVCEPHQTDRWIKTALEMDVGEPQAVRVPF